ncbi:MAG: hypothetical protein AAGF19_09710, partial [Pseudomonadota bacterium]
ADWIVDLGPEGGDGGGQVIAEGPPEAVAGIKASYTGHYLRPSLEKAGRLPLEGPAGDNEDDKPLRMISPKRKPARGRKAPTKRARKSA